MAAPKIFEKFRPPPTIDPTNPVKIVRDILTRDLSATDPPIEKKGEILLRYMMSDRAWSLSIIIPTRNRTPILTELLQSIARLHELERIRPEVIVADNNSQDNTCSCVASMSKKFPAPLRLLKVTRPGKSAAVNEAVKSATGEILAFLDDDVIVDRTWLTAVESFFCGNKYRVGQGLIRLQSPASNDPEILKLVQRYRTIPQLEYDADTEAVHSLNGANFFLHREVFNQAEGLDERLGPGASGTSEDVDFARRLARAGIAIGYAPQAVVYHRVDRERLTEAYFKEIHRRQGASRLLLRDYSRAEILFNLSHALAKYACYSVTGQERRRYRAKGRIHHYLAMIEAKRAQSFGARH
ncbi:MAG: glycosyltransferase family 2 protein [Chloroflexota bacterium]